MRHRISAGALVMRENRVLLLRHQVPGSYDFWAPPGGGVEGSEQLAETAEREVREEAGIVALIGRLAYIDELIDSSCRIVKFWFLANYLSGEINLSANPSQDEAITEAGWFSRSELPPGHVFPEVLHHEFWEQLVSAFEKPIKLPLQQSIF